MVAQNLPTNLQHLDCLSVKSQREFLAACNDLSFDSQLILMKYLSNDYNFPIINYVFEKSFARFRKGFFKIALKHNNELIRYLAAKKVLESSKGGFFYNNFLPLLQKAFMQNTKLTSQEMTLLESKYNSIIENEKDFEDKKTLELLKIVITDPSALVRYSLLEGLDTIYEEKRK